MSRDIDNAPEISIIQENAIQILFVIYRAICLVADFIRADFSKKILQPIIETASK